MWSRPRLCVAVLLLTVTWLIVRELLLPLGGTKAVTVRIPLGSSAGEIGRILVDKRVVRSALGFRVLARMTGKSADLKPGAYDLTPAMTPSAIIGRISRGEVSARWITFPEGYTIRKMAERVGADGLAKEEIFERIALTQGRYFRTVFPHPSDSLEGYLFPDTYLLPVGSDEDALVRDMLAAFQHKVATPLDDEISRCGMSLHQVVTLASLIEREARVPKDRTLISAVLHNRLARNMPLQCDATILYALGRHKSRVYYVDLRVDSPYNTYRYRGLPPGPIANPGLDSIKAALRPARVGYLYYVARPDGSHIFTNTFAEHQRARREAHRKDAG